MDIITIGYTPDTSNDYSFQHKYRSESIKFYYMKDMLSGFFMCGISVLIQV